MVLLKSSMVPLGTDAPDFELQGIDGQRHSLERYQDKKIFVIVFMCNHCPYVQKIWDDLVTLEKQMSSEVQFLSINSNANLNYPEDSFENMKKYAAEKKQSFPYLFDKDQTVAKVFQAQCTPDIFVYNSNRKLAYRGAFEGLGPAIQALLHGQKPSGEQKHSMGCSIKWND